MRMMKLNGKQVMVSGEGKHVDVFLDKSWQRVRLSKLEEIK